MTTVFYFSGTGNTRYIAELFARMTQAECCSIEEKTNFPALVAQSDMICLCYPIYGSRPPRIMREFAAKLRHELREKKLVILCTQFLFSGDGARSLLDLLDPMQEVVYAEHFIMPNNISNFPPLPVAGSRAQARYGRNAEKKMRRICDNIKGGLIKKRGFHIGSRLLGLIQAVHLPRMERRAMGDVRINESCTRCGLCASVCPMENLTMTSEGVEQKGDCTLCFRCVNRCPERAMTVFVHGRVRRQYKNTMCI